MTAGGRLDPNMPFEDRVVLALLYRLHVEAQRVGDATDKIRTRKALDVAKAIAADVPAEP